MNALLEQFIVTEQPALSAVDVLPSLHDLSLLGLDAF